MFSFIWKIENWSMRFHKNSEYILSPYFVFKNLYNSSWCLKLFPSGVKEHQDSMCIFLCLEKSNEVKEIELDYKFEMMDYNNKILACQKFVNIFKEGKEHGSTSIIDLDTLSEEENYWEKDFLTIKCELTSKEAAEDKTCTYGCKAFTKIGVDKIAFNWNLELPDSSKWTDCKTVSFDSMLIEITLTAPGENFEIEIRKTSGATAKSKFMLCRFSLLDAKKAETVSKWETYFFESNNEVESWEFTPFLTKRQLQEGKESFLQSNKFTLKCEIDCSSNSIISFIENYMFNPSPQEHLQSEINMLSSLQADLRNLLIVKKHCDVKLKVGKDTIPAHKAILAARSPVFSAMFEQNMLENQTGIVNLNDIDASTVDVLLEYFYTGSIKDLSYESAFKLLMAADKYEVGSLKESCSTFLISVLSEINACALLAVADLIVCPRLKVSAMDYIVDNFEVIISSELWPEWIKTNCNLATEVFLKLSNRVKSVLKKA